VLASKSRVNPRAVTGTLLALALLAPRAEAQVHAPSMVDEDLPTEEPAETVRPQRPPRPGDPVPEPLPTTAEPAPAVPAARPAAAGAPPAPSAMPGVSISAEELRKLQRPIEPVRASYGRILEAWQARRAALREQDLARADAARDQMLNIQRELGIENLTPFAAALVREAERALGARLPEDALRHATFAVQLAPDLADGHLALARAQLAKEPGKPLAAASELWEALAAAAREPHTLRAFYGDVFSAALAALFTAAAASLFLLWARRLRLFLHDFRHLPLLRGGAPVQAGFLALVLLALPLAFRLGPFAVLFVLTLAVWLYLSSAERAVATAALLALAALPWLAQAAAVASAWTGSLAEEVFELEHGADAGDLAARLEGRAETQGLPPPALMALGRHHKRRGDLEGARRWFESAAAADGGSAEVQVNLGNVLFLRGDLDGAKAAYLGATDRVQNITTLAAAHYNLSKLYLRLASVEQSSEARKKAQQEDAAYLARHGSDDDFRANRYLVDVTVPAGQLAALARGDESARSIGQAVRARLAGAIPAPLWPWAPLGLTGGLWLLGLAARRLGVSSDCERCGRPACRRCDGVTSSLCGQCVNVFMRQGVVDARDRLRKEAQVRRHGQWKQVVTRVLAVVGGGAGHLIRGEPVRGALLMLGLLFLGFVVWFWRGVLPPPHPSPYAVAGRILLAAPLGLALYAFAVRDAFRRSRT
jgi:tetratricopeptide (TPR) repeat protein